MSKRWSRKFERCIQCGRTEHRHASRGRCTLCHQRDYKKTYTPPEPSGPQWQEANRLLERGLTQAEIGVALGISRSRVGQLVANNAHKYEPIRRRCQRCHEYYVGPRKSHFCPNCTRNPARAVRFCPNCGAPRKLPAELCIRCSQRMRSKVAHHPEIYRRVLRLYKRGWGCSRISRRLGCAATTIWRLLHGRVTSRPFCNPLAKRQVSNYDVRLPRGPRPTTS